MADLNRVFGYANDQPLNSSSRIPRLAPGATVTVYLAGTVTPATIFADGAGLTPKANPFTADSNAYWFFYTDFDRVDVQISGANVAVTYTLGDVYPLYQTQIAASAFASFPAAGNQGLLRLRTDGIRGPYLDTGSAWRHFDAEVIHAQRDFGVTFDGVTDDTAAWQDVLDECDGRPIVCSPGTTVVTGGLSYITGAVGFTKGLKLIGAGSRQTIFDNRVANGPMLTVDTTGSFMVGTRISGIQIITSTLPANSDGILVKAQYQMVLEDIFIDGLSRDGIRTSMLLGDLDGGNAMLFDQIRVYNCGGWGIDNEAASGTVEMSYPVFRHVIVQNCTSGGQRFKGLNARFDQCAWLLNTTVGLHCALQGAVEMRNLMIENCTFEHNSTRHLDIDSSTSLIVQNCDFVSANVNQFGTGEPATMLDVIRLGNLGTIINARFENIFMRIAPTNNTCSAFNLSATCQYVALKKIRWDQFDAAGQTRFTIAGGALRTEIEDDGVKYPYPSAILSQSLGAGSSFTPDIGKYKIFELTYTATGAHTINYVVDTIGTFGTGREIVFIIRNASGGAITVSFNGNYSMTGYSDPANGAKTAVMGCFGANGFHRTCNWTTG